MKSLFKNLLLLTTIFSLAFLFSCGDEDPEDEVLPTGPSISVDTKVNGTAATSPIEAQPGDEITFDVSITSEGGFNVYRIHTSVDEGSPSTTELTRIDLDLDAGATAVTDSRAVEIEEAHVGSTLTFEFEVVDDANQTSTTTVVVEVTSPEARSYTAVLLAAPIGAETAEKTSETFFSTNTGLTYSMKEINESSDPLSANIDFGYFYGSGEGQTEATLSDPESYPFAYGQAAWGTRNSTTFRRTSLDASAFAEVTDFSAIDAAFEAAEAADTDAGIESNLEVGEVLAFATDADKEGGSKKGLILVKSIVEGDGETGQIELEILVQEEVE